MYQVAPLSVQSECEMVGIILSDVSKQAIEGRWALLHGVRQARGEADADGCTRERIYSVQWAE